MSALGSLRTLALSAAFTLMPIAAYAAPPLPAGFDTECMETILLDCSVSAAGMTTLMDGVGIAYQIQTGYSEETGSGAGVVLFDLVDDAWTLLDRDYAGVVYEVPRLVEGEEIILHVAGFTAGTGSYNADLLYVRDYESPEWRKIDLESWREDVVALLPEGLEIWKGVDFDFGDWFWAAYNARTPLWQQSDANCCPTGGWAEIEFEIVGDRMVPVRVYYRPEDEGAVAP